MHIVTPYIRVIECSSSDRSSYTRNSGWASGGPSLPDASTVRIEPPITFKWQSASDWVSKIHHIF